jgi:hypothetical protein
MIVVSWIMTPCSLVSDYQGFGGKRCLHIHSHPPEIWQTPTNLQTLSVSPVKISTLTPLSFKELACEREHYRTGCHLNPDQVFNIHAIYIYIYIYSLCRRPVIFLDLRFTLRQLSRVLSPGIYGAM